MVSKLIRGIALSWFFIILTVGSFTIFGAEKDWFNLNPLLHLHNEAKDPVANFTFSPDGDCPNVPVKFTNTSNGDDLTYLWDFGDGKTSTEKNPTHTFPSEVGGGTRSYNVKLTVTDKGKKNNSENHSVKVKQIPSMAVTSDQTDTDFEGLQYFISCENKDTEFTFKNKALSSENNATYEINWGDGSPKYSGTNWSELTHKYKVGIYKLTYKVTPVNGCEVTKVYGVFIGSNPAVGLENPGNTNVCSGEKLTFPITGTEKNPVGTTYTVTFSDGTTPITYPHPPPASVSHIFTKGSCGESIVDFENSFSVKIVALNPCSKSQASVVPIYVSELSIPEFTIDKELSCINEKITIRNTTDFKTEVDARGKCNEKKNFVWEISPATGWGLPTGEGLGNYSNPNDPSSWSTGSETINPKVTTPGTYKIKLITGNKCGIREETKTITILPIPKPSFTLASNEVCGPAIVKVTNTSNILNIPAANTPTTYEWTVGYSKGNCGNGSGYTFASETNKYSVNPIFNFTKPGIYTLTLKINSTCGTYTTKQAITVTAPPIIKIEPIQSSCGPIKVRPKATVSTCESGTPTYKWTFEGGTPATSTLLDPGEIKFSTVGNHKVSLEVTGSCGVKKEETNFTISSPPTISAGADEEICNGETVELKGTVTEDSGNFTYQWTSSPASAISNPKILKPNVKPTKTTIYTLKVKNVDTGCESEDQVEIKVIPAPIIGFDKPDQILCSGETSKLVNVLSTPAGEAVSWTADAKGVAGVVASGTTQIPTQVLINKTGLPITLVYTATIKAASQGNCAITPVKYTIIVNPEPDYTDDKLSICSGKGFSYTPSNNISKSQFTWAVSAPTGITGASNATQASSSVSQQLTNMTSAPIKVVYTVSPTLNGCKGKSFKLEVEVEPSFSLSFSEPDQIVCSGETSKIVKVITNPAGGDVIWESVTAGVDGLVKAGTTQIPAQVLINKTDQPITIIYTAKITDAGQGNCKVSPVKYKITVNPDPEYSDDEFSICGGESINYKPSNTISGTEFTWTVSAPAGISGAVNSTQAAATISQKLANATNAPITVTYTVSPSVFGCKGKSFKLEVEVKPSFSLAFSQADQILCSGETSKPIDVISTPADGPLTWTSVANGVTGVAANGTDQIPAQTLTNKTGKPIKVVYTATINAANQGNCAVTPLKYTITVNPDPEYSDDKLSICGGESIDYKPTNTISGTEFTWTVNAPTGITGASNSTQAESSISQQLTNTTNAPITAVYTVSPSVFGCKGKSFKLEVEVQPSPSISFSQLDQNLCTGSDSKEVKLSSDVAGAVFTWTADAKGVVGVSTSGTDVIPVQSLTNSTNQPITVEYKVMVKTSSAGACAGIPKTYRITVNPSVKIQSTVSEFNGFQISCNGANDGNITLNPTGGNGVFTFDWTGPSGFTSSLKDLSNLSPGLYKVKVSDEFGCSVSKQFDLKEPQKLVANVGNVEKVLCAGEETGAIDLVVSGGVKAYSFAWKRNGIPISQTTQNLSGVAAGTYDVEVLDANGCVYPISGIVISEPAAALVINFTKTDITCYDANDGSLDLNVSGGVPPYIINWTFGSDQPGFTNLGPGDYTLTVSDQSGCSRSQTITIEDAPLFKIEPVVKNISCFGEIDGSIELNLQGGVGATTIRWDHGSQLEKLYNLTAGTYGVTIKDQTDCEIRSEFNIVEPALLALEPKVKDALDCDNPQSGEILLGISGGTPPYAIQWSNGQTNENLIEITSGQYAVTITDASGCKIDKVFEVKRPPALTITAFQSTKVQCEPRYVEEEINITVSGGIAPYSISWSGGSISSDQRTMTTSEPGYYEVTVVDGKGCATTQSFDIENTETIAKSEIESATFDQYNSYLVNFEIQFWNRSFGKILTYHWDFGDGSESFDEHPKHKYVAEGEYEVVLTVSDVFGCSVEVRKKISVFDYYLVVPNVFTPNGDGINDYFFPRFVGIESLEFWVLNKWGETIYYTDDMSSQGWDGKLNDEQSIPGNYVYKLRFKTLDGRTQTMTDLFMLLK